MKSRSVLAAGAMALAIALFALAVLEISFPRTFSVAGMIGWPTRFRIHTGCAEVVFSCLCLWPAFRLDSRLASKILETASRLGLGGMFVFASWFKIQDPQGFALLVAQYQFLPPQAINLFALFMPQLELWTGLLLIISPWSREMALLLLAMFASFIVALGQAVVRDLGITCGCFELEGAMDKKEAWISLVRDLVLLAPTLWLVTRPSRSLIRVWKER